jgi:succinyl-CoA synthetase beta subunit
VAEAEINPLIVRSEGEGVVAVDGLIAFGFETSKKIPKSTNPA